MEGRGGGGRKGMALKSIKSSSVGGDSSPRPDAPYNPTDYYYYSFIYSRFYMADI